MVFFVLQKDSSSILDQLSFPTYNVEYFYKSNILYMTSSNIILLKMN